VEVRQLFVNTPVRRKFLRTVATEFGHAAEQFTRIALAHPRLAAVLRHNERMVYELPATDRVLDRLTLFYGSDLAEKLIWVESQTDAARLWGFVGHPSESRSTRKGQYLFLNGRWIQDRSLQHALGEAYRGLLMTGRYPIAFLFLELHPEQVDVNAHPTKTEVRFREAPALYRQLLSTLRSRFLTASLEQTVSLPAAASGLRWERAAPPVDPKRQLAAQEELAAWARQQLAEWTPDRPATFADVLPPDDERGLPFEPQSPHPADRWSDLEGIGQPQPLALPAGFGDVGPASAGEDPSPGGPAGEGEPAASPTPDALPSLPGPKQVMQVLDCYLIVETDEGITVVDQHALHERVVYEHLRRRVMEGAVESQRVLVPQPLEFAPREAAVLLESRDLLRQVGYQVEEFGGTTLLLAGYPAMLSRADHAQVLSDMAEELSTAGHAPGRRDILDSLLHMMACKAAVKAGQRLKPEEMESLLAQRHLIDDAHHCPHGRPTALVLTRTELDRQFGRLG
jgi:DNA mismatch repair protein MutL